MKNQNFVYSMMLSLFITLILAGCTNSAAENAQISKVQSDIANTTQTEDQGDVRVYEAAGSYVSPAGAENLDVKISYQGGKVVDIQMTSDTDHLASIKFQKLFIDGVKTQIIGKSLNEIGEFDKVNGSSLTATGFNQALKSIKEQVKA